MKQTLSHPSTKNLPAKVIQSYKSTFLPNIIQRAIPIKQISQAIMNHNINNMQFVGRNVQKDFNFRISLLVERERISQTVVLKKIRESSPLTYISPSGICMLHIFRTC
ncbi:hypothetical protein QL285_014113 [Trifolium repens]|nr:hypothetical protein QL285_014113 [Trifolium repens]